MTVRTYTLNVRLTVVMLGRADEDTSLLQLKNTADTAASEMAKAIAASGYRGGIAASLDAIEVAKRGELE